MAKYDFSVPTFDFQPKSSDITDPFGRTVTDIFGSTLTQEPGGSLGSRSSYTTESIFGPGFGSISTMPFTPSFGSGPSISSGPATSQTMPGRISRGGATSRPSYGGISSGGTTVMPRAINAPIEFSLGYAPTTTKLEQDFGKWGGQSAMEANKLYKQQFEQFTPGMEAGTRALSQRGAALSSGKLTPEITGDVSRAVASLGFGTGIGSRSQAGRNLLARDLGLSSLQLSQQGADLLGRSSALAQQAMQAMSPITPSQVFSTAFQIAEYNRNLANQDLFNAWMSRPLPGTFDVTKGQFVGFEPGSYSSTRPLVPGSQLTSGGGISGAASNAMVRNWTGALAPSPMFS